MPTARLALPQTAETPAAARSGPRFGFRAAYARSADSQAHGDTGQDYVALRVDDERLAFALCDGVSQSFMGDMAAQTVGEALADWLWQALPEANDATPIRPALAEFLAQLAPPTAERVRTFALAPDLLPMIRDVLERKRELGTETTFVGVCADAVSGRLTLAWMGDSRLRLWGPDGELTTALLGADKFLTVERWSSRRGLVGELHVAVLPLRRIKRLIAYSDGLAPYDLKLAQHLSDADLNRLVAATKQLPTSDDVSVVEMWMGQRPAPVKLALAPSDTSQTMMALPAVKPPPTIVSSSALTETLAPTSPTPYRPVSRPAPARKTSPWLWLAAGVPVVLCAVIALVSIVLGRDWVLKALGQNTPTPTASLTVEPTASPIPMRSATATETATASATPELTGTLTATPPPTLTETQTETPSPTLEMTLTLTPTVTLTETATVTATLTLTVTTP